jgi:hypothetical protein
VERDSVQNINAQGTFMQEAIGARIAIGSEDDLLLVSAEAGIVMSSPLWIPNTINTMTVREIFNILQKPRIMLYSPWMPA